ncbi:MAG: hypothetical protein ACYCOU_02075 [Sulfobacillus sp.]
MTHVKRIAGDRARKPTPPKPAHAEREATCIGCNCTDRRGCVTHDDFGARSTCSWLRVNWRTGRGICSSCAHLVPKWDRNQSHGIVYGKGTGTGKTKQFG